MIYTLSNEADSLFEDGKVRLSIDTTHEEALEILAAAIKIHNRPDPDPILAALKRQLYGWYPTYPTT